MELTTAGQSQPTLLTKTQGLQIVCHLQHHMADHSISVLSSSPFCILFLIFISGTISDAAAPALGTFNYVNQIEKGTPYIVEYVSNYRPLELYNFPFLMCFYSTTLITFT